MNIRIGLCVLALASTCFADIAPPRPKGTPVTLEVRSARSAAVTLQIPANLLKSSRAEGLHFDNDYDSGVRWRKVIGGVLLSLSFGLAGIWVVRRKLSRPAQAAMILTALVLAGASVTLADLRRPGETGRRPRRPIPAPSFDPGTLLKLRGALGTEALSGKVSVEVVPEGQPITLIIPAQR